MGELRKHGGTGSTRERYRPRPNSKERRYHAMIMEKPCMGCGIEPAGVAHHPLMKSPLQRYRRDHEFVVPVCHNCHTEIHDHIGNEEMWTSNHGCRLPVRYAEQLRDEGKRKGYL